jgi:protoporphyrinogen oxidase
MRDHHASAPIVIVGAGPCGLAAARELDRLGHPNWVLLERHAVPGGLAASVRDVAGFTWDLGGHVVFSHFREFDALLEAVMGDDLLYHDRSSYVRFRDRWVPYPFQNNLHRLPAAVRDECLEGLRDAHQRRAAKPSPDNLADWMLRVFGEGITRYFMRPYNLKVWATPLECMSAEWIAERVSVVGYERVLANTRRGFDDVAWGPNSTFAFPSSGGTGEIYRRLAAPMAGRIRYRTRVVGVDSAARRVRAADGSSVPYAALISTMPLDQLLAALPEVPPPVRAAGAELQHNGVLMVGVGYEQPLTDTKSWMYYPDPDVPFYRVTNFAKYAPANVPDGETRRYSSYMTETAYSPHQPVVRAALEDAVEGALRSSGTVQGKPRLASIHVEDIEYGYPVPTVGRDRALAAIQPWLAAQDIYSRGRFGTWRYEHGNMDYAIKMGIEVAGRIVTGAPETLASITSSQENT